MPYSLSIADRLSTVERDSVLRDVALLRSELDRMEDAAKRNSTHGVVTSYDSLALLSESGRRFILDGIGR